MSRPAVDTGPASDRADHWNGRYQTVGSANVSWYTPDMSVSVELLTLAGTSPTTSVLDAGGGTSLLVDRLVDLGVDDVTVVDISQAALDEARQRLAAHHPRNQVRWVLADLLTWSPGRTWDVWHDRAVFHFLTQPAEIATYVDLVGTCVGPHGHVVLGTFSPAGPPTCSGLPVARYSPQALAGLFAHHFDLVRSVTEDHLTPAGTFQQFSWVLLRRRDG